MRRPSLLLPTALLLGVFLLNLGMLKKNKVLSFPASSWSPREPWWEQGAGRWLLSSLPTRIQSTAVSPKSHLSGDCQPLGWCLQTELRWRLQSCVLRRNNLALSGGNEPGQSSWLASQPPPPERGGQSAALVALPSVCACP